MRGCRPLTESEFDAVMASFSGVQKNRNRTLFVMGVTTGFRISELLSLSIGDVYRNGRWKDRITVKRVNMKGKKDSRSVAVAPLLARSLFYFVDRTADPAAPLFPSRKKSSVHLSRHQAYRALRAAFEGANVWLDIPGTHTMRKTFAARLFSLLDENVWKLQGAMGHKSPASTVAYLSFNDEDTSNAIQTAFPS